MRRLQAKARHDMSENELDELRRQAARSIEQTLECLGQLYRNLREMDRTIALICELRDRESDT